jgi:hypothetical protein
VATATTAVRLATTLETAPSLNGKARDSPLDAVVVAVDQVVAVAELAEVVAEAEVRVNN